MIVITDLPKHSLIHSREIKRWLAEYRDILEADKMTPATKRKRKQIQIVIDTIDDGDKPF